MNNQTISQPTMDNDNQYRHIELVFDTALKPKFEEKKGKGYIEYGADNLYPNYLLGLYNESPKHGAIVKSKCVYIFGKGFDKNEIANTRGESFNSILKKCVQDDELYRGFYLQIIWNRAKKIGEIYHLDFHKVRVSKDLTKFFVKNDWSDYREKVREYEAFNESNPYGSQIFYYKEYNPSCEWYPLPNYFQGLAYIESDIEVSRYILGNSKQGFSSSTLVNFNNGDPVTDEKRKEIEKKFLKKFTGSDGRRVIIMFNKSRDNSAEIVNLGNTMLTKEDFTNINGLIQQEIFASHQITTPALMGIVTPGSLGQRNEIRDGYEIFNNTYIQNRQMNMVEIFNRFRTNMGFVEETKIIPVEPLKFEFTENIMSQNMTKDEIRQLMGREPLDNAIKTTAKIISDNINALSPLVANKVLESMTPAEIRSLAGLTENTPTTNTSPEQPAQMQSNDAIKNLTGRQMQNVMRIVRHFGTGKLTKEQATLMLKNGFGFTDDDVNSFLGIDANPLTDDEIQKFSMSEDDRMVMEFESCGEKKNEFQIVSSKPAMMVQYFADDLTDAQANVLDMMTRERGKITPEIIAKNLEMDVDIVKTIINDFIDNKIIKQIESKLNDDPMYKVLKPLSELGSTRPNVTKLYIRYSYEGVKDNKNRPFCAKMLQLSETKMWSRADIENISARLGYSVWDRRGGWYTIPGTDERRPYCRHNWVSHLVKKVNE